MKPNLPIDESPAGPWVDRIAALVLVALLPNAGNFGLPVTRFAFGEEGLARAGVFFITASVLTYTVGVFVASLGRSGPSSFRFLMRVPFAL